MGASVNTNAANNIVQIGCDNGSKSTSIELSNYNTNGFVKIKAEDGMDNIIESTFDGNDGSISINSENDSGNQTRQTISPVTVSNFITDGFNSSTLELNPTYSYSKSSYGDLEDVISLDPNEDNVYGTCFQSLNTDTGLYSRLNMRSDAANLFADSGFGSSGAIGVKLDRVSSSVVDGSNSGTTNLTPTNFAVEVTDPSTIKYLNMGTTARIGASDGANEASTDYNPTGLVETIVSSSNGYILDRVTDGTNISNIVQNISSLQTSIEHNEAFIYNSASTIPSGGSTQTRFIMDPKGIADGNLWDTTDGSYTSKVELEPSKLTNEVTDGTDSCKSEYTSGEIYVESKSGGNVVVTSITPVSYGQSVTDGVTSSSISSNASQINLDAILINLLGKVTGIASNTSTAAASLAMTTPKMLNYIIFTGTTSVFTLPSISGNTGVRYVIINKGSGSITLNSNAGANDIWDAGTTTTTTVILPGSTINIYNDGTNFSII